jgi:transposase
MSEQRQKRYIGLDLHKHTIMVAGLNAQQEVVLRPRRVALVELEVWAQAHLKATDEVVLEATSNAWWAYDLLTPLVERVVVASPHDVKLIAASLVKTDKKDALTLARLLAVNLVPEVWVPPSEVRELRGLVSHRQRLIRQRTAARNRLRGLLQRHHLLPPEGGLFNQANRAWWHSLSLPPVEQLRSRHDLGLLEVLEPLIAEVEAELARLSVQEPWQSQCAFLIQLPGIGLITAMTILAAVGQIERFPSAKKLVGYSGLGSRIYATGQTQRTGGITKQGRRELRVVLIEAAWIAVQHQPYWRRQFEQLSARRGQHKAIVAIARKLLVVVWHVLSLQALDRQAQPEAITRSFYRWSDTHRLAKQLNLSRAEFVRRELVRLGLDPELAISVTRHQPAAALLPQAA